MKGRPDKGAAKLARDGALTVIAVAAQIAEVDAAPQREDCGEQDAKELGLGFTDRRHLLEDVVANCHRPFTGCSGVRYFYSTHVQGVRLNHPILLGRRNQLWYEAV